MFGYWLGESRLRHKSGICRAETRKHGADINVDRFLLGEVPHTLHSHVGSLAQSILAKNVNLTVIMLILRNYFSNVFDEFRVVKWLSYRCRLLKVVRFQNFKLSAHLSVFGFDIVIRFHVDVSRGFLVFQNQLHVEFGIGKVDGNREHVILQKYFNKWMLSSGFPEFGVFSEEGINLCKWPIFHFSFLVFSRILTWIGMCFPSVISLVNCNVRLTDFSLVMDWCSNSRSAI